MAQESVEKMESGSVESVILALQKVISLLDRIKNTIEESSGKIPKAAVQLNTVTRATEMATVEILNGLDAMAQKIDRAEESLNIVRPGVNERDDQVRMDDIAQSLREVKDSALAITMALQVQDITAQKIAAVNHLIESVRMELLHELNYFQSTDHEQAVRPVNSGTNDSPDQESQAFDKNASFRKTAEHQKHIDNVIFAWKEKQSMRQATH